MIEIQLKDGRIWKFKDDLTMAEIDTLGDAPKPLDGSSVTEKYNRAKICLFSVDPKLTPADFAA